MPFDSHVILGAALAGIGATLLIDLWALLLKRALAIPSLNLCLLGRWVLHMPGGTFRHESIAAAMPKAGECGLGWVCHYLIGTGLALIFALLAPAGWFARPTFWPAVAFGIVTTVIPLFVMQPALGLGVASSRAPKPTQARLKSLATHTVYGLGLYLSAALLSRVLDQS
jgi:Protein of unknown function (DUF2938)